MTDAPSNHIISTLAPGRSAELIALGVVGPLTQGEVLAEPEEPLTRLIFPISGALSILTVMSDGESVEAGLVGREGMLGPVWTDMESGNPWRVVVQLPGAALFVRTREIVARPALIEALQPLERRYARASHWLATLSIGCNRFHSLDQRLARWLLMMHDRADGNQMPITHQFLSEMLGARRQSVTRALHLLERRDLIGRVGRGHILVVDRAGLEAAACECYERMLRVLPAEHPTLRDVGPR